MFTNISIRTSLLFVVGVLIGMLVIVGAGCMLALSTSNRSVTLAEADMTTADAPTSAYSSLVRARAAFDACDRQFGNGDLDASKVSMTNGRSLVGAANESWTRFRNAISDSPQNDADSSVIRAYGDLMDSTLSVDNCRDYSTYIPALRSAICSEETFERPCRGEIKRPKMAGLCPMRSAEADPLPSFGPSREQWSLPRYSGPSPISVGRRMLACHSDTEGL